MEKENLIGRRVKLISDRFVCANVGDVGVITDVITYHHFEDDCEVKFDGCCIGCEFSDIEFLPLSPKANILNSSQIFEALTSREQCLLDIDRLKEHTQKIKDSIFEMEQEILSNETAIESLKKKVSHSVNTIDAHNEAVEQLKAKE